MDCVSWLSDRYAWARLKRITGDAKSRYAVWNSWIASAKRPAW